MTSQLSFISKQIRKNPYLLFFTGILSFSIGGIVYIGYHKLNDPTIVFKNRAINSYPWIYVRQNENLKLYNINNKFSEYDNKPRETFILNKTFKN